MSGIYSYNSAEKLFEKLKNDFSIFCDEPNEESIYGLIFPFYHLREWIHPAGYEAYKDKNHEHLSKEEHLHNYLHDMKEYEVIRALCNNAKHFNVSGSGNKMESLEGARAGLMRVDDSLSITHFLVDGIEIRDIFWPVYSVYFKYFEKT